MVPDALRGALITELVKLTHCGIDQQRGRWYLYGRSVTALHALGQAIVKHRSAFDAMSDPAWVGALDEELKRLNDS
ncbi:hypothetical protein ACFW9I_08375 [[Kitasatospora] papulosa]|uniref:hypothetical protein n=1 Tax=[Kitasatospora] papulosa TaxID=1464011 RepID=UPI0036955FC1